MSASHTVEINPESDTTAYVQSLMDPAGFKSHLDQFKDLQWLYLLKQEAWTRFNEMAMPKRTDEAWRFASPLELNLESFHLSQAPTEVEQINIVNASNIVKNYAGRMIFEDNHLLDHDFVSDELESQGVIWEPLLEAFEKHPMLLKSYLSKGEATLGSEKFYHLSIAYAHAGAFIYVPKGVKVKEPLINYYWSNAKNSALFPQTIVIAEEGAEVSVIDVYQSHNKEDGAFAVSNGFIMAHENAKVSRTTVQNWSEKVISFQLDKSLACKDGQTQTAAVNIGAQRARFENVVEIEGAGAHCELSALAVADKGQEHDQRTRQIHNAPHAVSDLLYKNALLEKGKTTFSGLILVDEKAQQTDAYQTNRNLMLSDDATANSLPGLEIEANDVKCSHGATTGSINNDEMFYMLSRGIAKEQAQALLVFGFLEEIVNKIENEDLVAYLHDIIPQKCSSQLHVGGIELE